MIADIIHKVAGMEQEEWKYSPRPSSNDKCLRALVYHALGVARQPFPGRTIMVFDDGNFHEDLTGDWIRKTVYKLHSEQMEVHCYDVGGKKIYGHIDGIITDLAGTDRLFEHKSINHFGFERIWGGELPVGYIGQCCCYLRGLQKDFPDIREAVLLFKNKNTAAYFEIILEYDIETDTCDVLAMTHSSEGVKSIGEKIENIIAGIVEKYEKVEDYRKKKTLPARPYSFTDSTQFPCSYCGWWESCWGNYEEEVEALEKDAALGDELNTAAGYYLETNLHIDELKKEKEKIRQQVIDELKKRGASGGKTSSYYIALSLTKYTSIDKTKIPASILAEAQNITMSERLSIRKLKEKK